jgi:hypothetical protein
MRRAVMEQPKTAIACVSLGMIIIDDIQFPNQAPLTNITGGSSSYITLGSRLFASKPASIGCFVLCGDDFPRSVEAELKGWGITLVSRKQANIQSTRGLLEYEDSTFGRKLHFLVKRKYKADPSDSQDIPLHHHSTQNSTRRFGGHAFLACQSYPLLRHTRRDSYSGSGAHAPTESIR